MCAMGPAELESIYAVLNSRCFVQVYNHVLLNDVCIFSNSRRVGSQLNYQLPLSETR